MGIGGASHREVLELGLTEGFGDGVVIENRRQPDTWKPVFLGPWQRMGRDGFRENERTLVVRTGGILVSSSQ